MQKLLVVGGNGFVAAIARGWDVASFSRSGTPYATAKGHSPAWTQKVSWHSGSLDDASTFSHLLDDRTAVVHTLGILLEGGEYKNGLGGLARSLLRGRFGSSQDNPLEAPEDRPGSYEYTNRETALKVARAFAASPQSTGSSSSPFVYLSAEDFSRPLIPARYIETKRSAERALSEIATSSILQSVSQETGAGRALRPVFVRPSLIYHPHIRPLSTLPAALLDLSANIQARLPPALQAPRVLGSLPLPRALAPDSLANLLTIPPIHVDTVASAICQAIENEDVVGPLGVSAMRELVGFKSDQPEPVHA